MKGKKDSTQENLVQTKTSKQLQQRRRGTEDGDRLTDPEMKHPAAQAHVYLASNSHPKWPNMTNINEHLTDNLHLKTPCTSSTVCNSNSSNPKRVKTAAGFLHR